MYYLQTFMLDATYRFDSTKLSNYIFNFYLSLYLFLSHEIQI